MAWPSRPGSRQPGQALCKRLRKGAYIRRGGPGGARLLKGPGAGVPSGHAPAEGASHTPTPVLRPFIPVIIIAVDVVCQPSDLPRGRAQPALLPAAAGWCLLSLASVSPPVQCACVLGLLREKRVETQRGLGARGEH